MSGAPWSDQARLCPGPNLAAGMCFEPPVAPGLEKGDDRVEHSVVGPRIYPSTGCGGYQAAKPFDGCQLHLSGTTAALVRSYGYQTEEPFDICQYRPLVRVLYYCQFV